jgi:hypothetical protein
MLVLVVPIRDASPGEPSPRAMSFAMFELVVPALAAIPMRLIVFRSGVQGRHMHLASDEVVEMKQCIDPYDHGSI